MQPEPILSARVLIVDDEPRNLLALEAALAGVDCGVVKAHTGGEALEWVLKDDFAAIVLDIHMPDMDGFETAGLIRARERSQTTPIIFLTADDRRGARVLEGYRLGAVDYLYKPFNPDILCSKIGFFVDLFRKTAALKQRTAELNVLAAELAHTRAEADLRHQALHDALTGLPNRILLHERLEQAIVGSDAEHSSCALLLLDLDRFKAVNDTLGHQMGDSLLQQLGHRLREAVPQHDLVARLGSDEFAVLLIRSDAVRAVQVAEHVVDSLRAPFMLEGQAIGVAVSVGIAVAPKHGQNADTLLRHADAAMYQAKELGLGVAEYGVATDQHRPEHLMLLGELRLAIERDGLLVHYQPQLDLREGTLVALEALVRWQHPVRGFLPPSEFMPLAEMSGLIHPLSLWVLETALRQQRSWRDLGIDIPVAVNLSRRMLHDPGLSETVARLLTLYDVRPSGLILELTESSLMVEPIRAGENLKRLHLLGVRMSIDDFGTGYSSLASLKNLSVDELKIDESFVRAMATDASSRAIVRAIIDLADALNLRVVAEGVEDRATWDVLAGLGCDAAQGYLVSPPFAAADLGLWIAQVGPTWVEIAVQPSARDPLRARIRGRGARLTAEEEFLARHEAEAALHISEERNRLALQAARMGTWDADPIHDVVSWSPETEALHGLAPGTFEGTFAAFQRTIDPADWPAFETEMLASIAERRESIVTFRTIWPDGSGHYIESKSRALYAADGSVSRVTGTSTDVTQRTVAEIALRASEERFRKQYKGIPLPTYSYDQVGDDFVLQDYNDAADTISEGRIREGLGKRASEWFADMPEILMDLRACVAEQQGFRRETSYRFRTTQRVRDLALSYVFIPPRTVMIHTEDITEAKHAEQQREAMAQSEKLRVVGQMATGIAHDLNQSLMLVSSYSHLARQALAQDPPDVAEASDLMTTAAQAAMDGGETVKRILMSTRTEPEQNSQMIELSGLVRDAAHLTSPRWRDAAQGEGRPISLHIEVEGQPMVLGSPGQLRELMTNLIFNAVDALPTGGTIRLRVLAAAGQGIVEVTDSGIGMSDEVQVRVFEPFFTTKGERGTGLGLAMVFGIVEQHRGQIGVRSAPGEGTTFRITLPLVSEIAVAEPSAKTKDVLDPLVLLRVLVVDDEPMMTKAVVRMLKPAGHLVTTAASAEEALERLANEDFDVVVSDVGMGAGMNGWELVDVVRGRWPDVRVMLATGWGAAIDPGEARTRGVEAVLSKPYHPIDLLQALARTGAAA